jgi:hypothetical protein
MLLPASPLMRNRHLPFSHTFLADSLSWCNTSKTRRTGRRATAPAPKQKKGTWMFVEASAQAVSVRAEARGGALGSSPRELGAVLPGVTA